MSFFSDDIEYYALLNVPINATKHELMTSYKRLLDRYDPMQPDREYHNKYRKIRQAYATLANPSFRFMYRLYGWREDKLARPRSELSAFAPSSSRFGSHDIVLVSKSSMPPFKYISDRPNRPYRELKMMREANPFKRNSLASPSIQYEYATEKQPLRVIVPMNLTRLYRGTECLKHVRTKVKCAACNGRGWYRDNGVDKVCDECDRSGYILKEETVKFKIPPLTPPGTQYVYRNGKVIRDTQLHPMDTAFVLKQCNDECRDCSEHFRLTQNGNLHVLKRICRGVAMSSMYCGLIYRFGEKVYVKYVGQRIDSLTTLCLPGFGFFPYANLYIHFTIVDEWTDDECRDYREATANYSLAHVLTRVMEVNGKYQSIASSKAGRQCTPVASKTNEQHTSTTHLSPQPITIIDDTSETETA